MTIQASARKRAKAAFLSRSLQSAFFALMLGLGVSFAHQPALALSELPQEQAPVATPAKPDQTTAPAATPQPGSAQPAGDSQAKPETGEPNQAMPDDDGPGGPFTPGADDSDDMSPPEIPQLAKRPSASEPAPEVIYDLGRLPTPVKATWDKLMEACKSADIQKLRPLIATGDHATQLSLSEIQGDPIEFLKGLGGDEDGLEILAILEEALTAGYVHLDAGTDEELYVWPYFFALPLEKLTPNQKVELFKLISAGDFEEMKYYGAYVFFRVGITPKGEWAFFVAGD